MGSANAVPVERQSGTTPDCRVDAYQGNTCILGTNKTGYFHIEALGGRLIWITPDGTGMFSKAVESISPSDGGAIYQAALKEKYGPHFQTLFANLALKRMQDWGFNTIGEYSASYVTPWRTKYGGGNPVKLPEKLLLNLSGVTSYGFSNRLFKNLWKGLDLQGGCRGCYIGYLADVIDPRFGPGVEAALRNVLTLQPTLATEPYLMMIMTDDGDNIFGLRRANAMHGGWMAAIMAPVQTRAVVRGEMVSYSDTTVYTKEAWLSYLKEKYHTVQSVNLAWGSTYSAFTGGAGWPKRTTGSTALIDEDGTSSWMATRDKNALSDLNVNLRKDLDSFRILIADKYASTVSGLVRLYISNHAVTNPGPLSANLVTDPNGRMLLQTFAKYYDVLTITGNCDEAGLAADVYNLVHRPLTVGIIITAQQDSPQAGFTTPFCNAATQTARGAAYVGNVRAFFNCKGADGVMPVIGMSWWEWTDKSTGGERGNFGLVTSKDNAYDGVEDRITAPPDRLGYKRGGEGSDYGDFISQVRDLNLSLDESVLKLFSKHH